MNDQKVEISSVYLVNNTISHPFSGDGITRVRGVDTQTFHIIAKLYQRIYLLAFHDHLGNDVFSDISGFDGPNIYSRQLSKENTFRIVSSLPLDNKTKNLTDNGCRSGQYVPSETKFEATQGFHMIVVIKGYDLASYCRGTLVYRSINVEPVYITVLPSPKQLNIPSQACQEDSFYITFCYYHIQANGVLETDSERGFVNVTINDIHVDGPNTDDCHMSGLALVSVSNDTNLQPYILWQNPVVIICRNTMMGTSTPFSTFISHTPDVAIIVYSYYPKNGRLKTDLNLVHSRCQGILIDCIPKLDEPFPGYNMKTVGHIPYIISDKKASHHSTYKISRLESGNKRLAHGECSNHLIPKFESYRNSIGHICIHCNDIYIQDATITWCRSPPDYGYIGLTTTITNSFININPYHTTNCIIVQAYPILQTTRHVGATSLHCKFDVIFIDTQTRLQRNQFQITSFSETLNRCDTNNLDLQQNEFKTNFIFNGRKSRQYKFWSTSVNLKDCGYFSINLNTSESSIMMLPIMPPANWPQLLPFQLPLQGSDLFQDLLHNIVIPKEQTISPIIAHFDPSQYIANTMKKVTSWVHSMPHYDTTITLTLLQNSQCPELSLTMDNIIRSTSDLYPYSYHHFIIELTLTPMRSFTFTEYLLMEQRYIRILPQSLLTCDGLVQLKLDPFNIIPQIYFSPDAINEDLSIRGEILFEDYNYIILYDVFRLSWNNAITKCSHLGGRLPVVNTKEKEQILTNLLLGDTFRNDTTNRFIRAPCRQNHGPLCGSFIGLHLQHSKVSFAVPILRISAFLIQEKTT